MPGLEQPYQLSLIIPVYNVAPYLQACLHSIAHQTQSNTQVIIVNDGSTDGCRSILEQWQVERPQWIILHQDNQGLSQARNAGLALATGQYIAFVDSDDWFEPDYYQRLVQLCQAHDLDMACANALYHFESGQPGYPVYDDNPPDGVIEGRELLEYRLARKSLLHMVWMNVYKAAFVRAHGLKFPPGVIHEDVSWTTRALLWAERVSCLNHTGYFYRRNRRVIPDDLHDKRLIHIMRSSVYNAIDLSSLIKTDPRVTTSLKRLIAWQLVDGGLSVFHKLNKLRDPELVRQTMAYLREKGFYRTLWDNAVTPAQKRRVLKNKVLFILTA